MFFSVSEGVKKLAENIRKNPDDWVQGNYYFSSKVSPDIQIWIADGDCNIRLRGNDLLTAREKRVISKAIKYCIAQKVTINPKKFFTEIRSYRKGNTKT